MFENFLIKGIIEIFLATFTYLIFKLFQAFAKVEMRENITLGMAGALLIFILLSLGLINILQGMKMI